MLSVCFTLRIFTGFVCVCVYTHISAPTGVSIFPLEIFLWSLYNYKSKTFSTAKMFTEWIQDQESSHCIHNPWTYHLDIPTENKCLNAKGWDMAHVTLEVNVGDGVWSRGGTVAHGTLQREKLVWNLRFSSIPGGEFWEVARKHPPSLLKDSVVVQVSASGWASLSPTSSSATSPLGTLGTLLSDSKSQGPPLWVGENGSSPTGLWGLSELIQVTCVTISTL